mmetsp:Transcript_16447/g.31171  ORF Transcript_16447/g.31171 Transcript_16447/m.31171 type:complete len:123 (-) Transcript_16447:3774-4142(-)
MDGIHIHTMTKYSQQETLEDDGLTVKREQLKKTNEDDRLKELEDQKVYLEEKLEFLSLKKTRNEKEISRLKADNIELKEMRSNIKRQLISFMDVVNDWQKFRDGIVKESNVWEQTAQTIDNP